MSVFDDFKKWLNGASPQQKSDFITQVLNDKALEDAFRNAGLSYTSLDRARELPLGVLSKILKVDLVDLITEITTIKTIETLDLITAITSVANIVNIQNLQSVDLIDAITNIGTLANLTSVGTVNLVNTISAITNIANIASLDLVDRITLIDAITNIGTLANLTNVGTINLINTLTTLGTVNQITNIANIQSLDLIDLITRIALIDRITLIDSITSIGTIGTVTVANVTQNPASATVSRPAWHDRNPLTVVLNYEGQNGHHTLTNRFTYTVPTGRKLFVEHASGLVMRESPPSDVNSAGALITVNDGGAGYTEVVRAHIFGTSVPLGVVDREQTGQSILAFAGQTLVAKSWNDSTSGLVRAIISLKGTEFDA